MNNAYIEELLEFPVKDVVIGLRVQERSLWLQGILPMNRYA
jgi:hypothetical protein